MKKREYIKPEMELLDSELIGFLCTSVVPTNQGVQGDGSGDDDYEGQGTVTPGGPGQVP